ncbi:hypothetical protein BGZ70_001278 [Mortierella alpina]|uniref:Hemolysin-III channel protein Izh2 n=1 Tax=Mortierella alpina TaxID=64518 RepID=A0A9P6JF71_MORAP|nr:hypothetical protein BGZ70_001278 [Mortierella alpina]
MISPTPSRKSSSTQLSKATAHDLSHTATTVHPTAHHQHTHSDATQVDTVKISMNTFGDSKDPLRDANTETDTEPVGIYSLAPCAHGDSNSTSDQHDTEKGEPCSRRHSTQAHDDTRGQNDTGPLCTWAELPAWMQDNPAIMTGYRRPTFSYRKALRSLGYLHNESVNIWSHLLGAVAFLILAPISYFKVVDVLDSIQWTDVAVFYAFLAGAIICLSMSASFHTFSCHSEPICSQWNRCDYVGIVFLIVGSFYPAIFYGFYCHKTWQIMYISLISTFGAATIFVVMRPKFRSPQFRWVRSGLFLGMGLSGLFPIVHGIVLYGFAMAQRAVALNYMFCMGAAYVFGALIYGSRVPECFFPGKFDHFAASHQIFHVCVLIGCAVHFLGVTKAMAFWHDVNHSCAIPLDELRSQFTS